MPNLDCTEKKIKRKAAQRSVKRAIGFFSIENDYIPKQRIIQDNVITAYGPRNGILWRGENQRLGLDERPNPIEILNTVFTTGFTPLSLAKLQEFRIRYARNYLTVGAEYPYIQQRFGDVISTSSFKEVASVFAEGDMVDDDDDHMMDGYVYMIDASKISDLTCVPLNKKNINKPVFKKGASGEEYDEYEFAVLGSIPSCVIIGAFPTDFSAFALGIRESTFIYNPNYSGALLLEEIKLKSQAKDFKEYSELRLEYPLEEDIIGFYETKKYQGYYLAKEISELMKEVTFSPRAIESSIMSRLVRDYPALKEEEIKQIASSVESQDTTSYLMFFKIAEYIFESKVQACSPKYLSC